MAMNSEQTTEEGSVELTLENYEEFLSHSLALAALRRSLEMNPIRITTTEERRVELTLENYENRFKQQEWLRDYLVCRVREYKRTSYPDADVKIISQVQPDFVTPRGGSNAIPVEPNYGTTGVGERTPADILLSRILMASRRAYIRAQANVGAGSGYMNETMPAEASPGFTAVGVEMNDIDRSYIRAQANFGAGSGYRVEWNDDMLPALLRSSARAIREHSSSQDFLVDEAGGRFLAIHIHPPQQGDRDQGLVGVAPGTQDGPGDLARQALPSVIGGLVPVCFNLLLDDNILKAGGSPGYIKAAAYAGLGLVTVFTFLGLASKKRAKAAARVVASASTAAVSIAVVYRVSDNAYIQCFCGIMGCVATLATMAIDW